MRRDIGQMEQIATSYTIGERDENRVGETNKQQGKGKIRRDELGLPFLYSGKLLEASELVSLQLTTVNHENKFQFANACCFSSLLGDTIE